MTHKYVIYIKYELKYKIHIFQSDLFCEIFYSFNIFKDKNLHNDIIFVGAGCACALLWCDICQLRYVATFVWLIVYFW